MSITEERAWSLIREIRRARDVGLNTTTITQEEARDLRISRSPGEGDCEVALWALELAITAQAEIRGWQVGLIPIAGNVRAAFEQIERLRALTTITDSMVEKAAEVLVYTMGQESDGACWISEWEGWTVIDGTFDIPSAVRAALEAALNPGDEA